jgi:hypothetical protein
MLSLRSGTIVAETVPEKKGGKTQKIYITEDDDDEKKPEIETTKENLVKIFKKHLSLNKKLNIKEINELTSSYENRELQIENPRLSRTYDNAKRYADNSTKKFLDFGTTETLIPCFSEDSVRVFTSGLSGSGKSTTISNIIEKNPPKGEGYVFLFSPIKGDKALAKIKRLLEVDLDDFERDMERPFSFEDINEGSICIFDDCETARKDLVPQYYQLMDMVGQRGRHKKISMYSVSHSAMNGNKTKSLIRESQYFLMFCSANKRDCKNLLKTYGGMDTNQIETIMTQKSRWCLFKKSIPQYAVFEHSIMLL